MKSIIIAVLISICVFGIFCKDMDIEKLHAWIDKINDVEVKSQNPCDDLNFKDQPALQAQWSFTCKEEK